MERGKARQSLFEFLSQGFLLFRVRALISTTGTESQVPYQVE